MEKNEDHVDTWSFSRCEFCPAPRHCTAALRPLKMCADFFQFLCPHLVNAEGISQQCSELADVVAHVLNPYIVFQSSQALG